LKKRKKKLKHNTRQEFYNEFSEEQDAKIAG